MTGDGRASNLPNVLLRACSPTYGRVAFCCRQVVGALPAAAGKLPVASCQNSATPCPGLKTAAALAGADALAKVFKEHQADRENSLSQEEETGRVIHQDGLRFCVG